jgi:hypothetical protein
MRPARCGKAVAVAADVVAAAVAVVVEADGAIINGNVEH